MEPIPAAVDPVELWADFLNADRFVVVTIDRRGAITGARLTDDLPAAMAACVRVSDAGGRAELYPATPLTDREWQAYRAQEAL